MGVVQRGVFGSGVYLGVMMTDMQLISAGAILTAALFGRSLRELARVRAR